MKTLILAGISVLFNVHRSCRCLNCLSRLGSGRSHHVPVHGQPIHLREWPLHHERLRDGNGDVGRSTGSEHAATEVKPQRTQSVSRTFSGSTSMDTDRRKRLKSG